MSEAPTTSAFPILRRRLRYDEDVLYRDPLAGLRSQIATKRGVLHSHERQIPLLLRALLPERIKKAIDGLRARALAEGDTLETLSDADAALDGVLAAYDEAVQLLPQLRECPEEVRDPPRPRQAPPYVFEEEREKHFRLRFVDRVHEIAPDAYLVRWGDYTYLSRFRVGRAPLIATATISAPIEVTPYFTTTLRTSVPAETPALHVRPENALEGLGKIVGLVEDRKVGNAALDDTFVVGGGEAAMALLTSDVIAALLALVPQKPSLRVARGVVELTCSGRDRAYAPDTLRDESIAVVLGVRAAIERA